MHWPSITQTILCGHILQEQVGGSLIFIKDSCAQNIIGLRCGGGEEGRVRGEGLTIVFTVKVIKKEAQVKSAWVSWRGQGRSWSPKAQDLRPGRVRPRHGLVRAGPPGVRGQALPVAHCPEVPRPAGAGWVRVVQRRQPSSAQVSKGANSSSQISSLPSP